MDEEDWTLDDLVQNARDAGVRASTELFRKARKDVFVQPLREATVEKLAAGLKTTKDHIRDLDFAYWQPSPAPVGSNVDPDLLAILNSLSATDLSRVRDFLLGIQAR